MGSFLSITAVLAFVIIGGFYFMSTQQQMRETNRGVAHDEYAVLARSAAIAGSERAKQHLARSFTEESFEGYFNQGTYDVEVTISGQMATIVSAGSAITSENRRITKTVRVAIESTTEPISAGFGRGLLVGGDLTIGGTGDVLSIGVTDSTITTLNANIHTNSNLFVNGTDARVAGFGTYTGTMTATTPDSTFQPNYNPSDAPSAYYSEPIHIPTVVPLQLANDFGMDVNISTDMPEAWDENGAWNCQLSGVLQGGSAADPRVFYCPGNFRMQDLLVDGYAIFIAEGATEIDGVVRSNVSTYPDGETSSLAIYSNDDIGLNGNDEVWAQLFTNATLRYQGGIDIYGSLTTLGSLVFNGNAFIHYRPTAEGLVPPRDPEVQMRIVAYSEE